MRSLAGLAGVLALAMVCTSCARLNLFRRAESRRVQPEGPVVGMPVPDIDGVDFAGKPLKLSHHKGKVVVVTFWFSQCGPCRAMIPHEREMVERFKSKPFALLSVNNDSDPEAARKIMMSQNMTWPNWKTSGTEDPIAQLWGVRSWPAVFVIDAKGILRYRDVRGALLENAVATLLAEMGDG